MAAQAGAKVGGTATSLSQLHSLLASIESGQLGPMRSAAKLGAVREDVVQGRAEWAALDAPVSTHRTAGPSAGVGAASTRVMSDAERQQWQDELRAQQLRNAGGRRRFQELRDPKLTTFLVSDTAGLDDEEAALLASSAPVSGRKPGGSRKGQGMNVSRTKPPPPAVLPPRKIPPAELSQSTPVLPTLPTGGPLPPLDTSLPVGRLPVIMMPSVQRATAAESLASASIQSIESIKPLKKKAVSRPDTVPGPPGLVNRKGAVALQLNNWARGMMIAGGSDNVATFIHGGAAQHLSPLLPQVIQTAIHRPTSPSAVHAKPETVDRSKPAAPPAPSAPPESPVEFKAAAAKLSVQLAGAKDRTMEFESKVVHSITEIAKSLPPELLEKMAQSRKIKDFTAAYGKKALNRVLRRLFNARKKAGFRQWKEQAARITAARRLHAAQEIQRVLRGHFGRQYVRRLRMIEAAEEAERQRAIAIQFRMRGVCVAIIQKWYRRNMRRKKTIKRRRQLAATRVLQRAWRAYRLRGMFRKCCRWGAMRRRTAAYVLQRTFRRFVLQKKIAIASAISRGEALRQARKAAKEQLQFKFVQRGAATRIAKAWRGYIQLRRLRGLLRFRRQVFATKIQRTYREMKARRWKRKNQERKEKQNRAAVKIQKVVRGFMARQLRKRIVAKRRAVEEARKAREAEKAAKQAEEAASVRGRMKAMFNVAGKVASQAQTAAKQVNGHSILFGLNKLNPLREKQELAAATNIQRIARGWRARRKVAGMRQAKKEANKAKKNARKAAAAGTIQRAWKSYLTRKWFWGFRRTKQTVMIQQAWKRYRNRAILRVIRSRRKGAVEFQRIWKGWRTYKKYRDAIRTRLIRIAAARKIQFQVRKMVAINRISDIIEQRKVREEYAKVAAAIVNHTARIRAGQLLLAEIVGLPDAGDDAARILKLSKEGMAVWKRRVDWMQAHEHETMGDFSIRDTVAMGALAIPVGCSMRNLFKELVRLSSTKSTNQVDGQRFAKFISQCPKFLDSKFAKPEVDLVFMTAKSTPQQRGLDYDEFIKALRQAIDRKLGNTPVTSAIPRVAAGTPTRVAYMMMESIMRCSDAYFQSQIAMTTKQVMWAFERAAFKIRRRYLARNAPQQGALLLAMRRAVLAKKLQDEKAAKIQRMIRRFLGVRSAADRAAHVYRAIQAENGMFFFFNPRTKRKVWTKPAVLGKRSVTRVPFCPKDEVFVVKCEMCSPVGDAAVLAVEFCEDCTISVCASCSAKLHRKGKRAAHAREKLRVCGLCEYQTATRQCGQCGDKQYQCDKCFEFLHTAPEPGTSHRKPNILVALCIECNKRAVQWRCDHCEDLYCTVCFKSTHAKGRLAWHTITPMPYVSTLASQKLAKLDEFAQLRTKLAIMQQEAEARLYRKQFAAAAKIQRAFRNHLTRKAMLAAANKLRREGRLHDRQEWLRAKEDTQVRSKIDYKLKNWLGIAPTLATDTEEEKKAKEDIPPWQRAAAIANIGGTEIPIWIQVPQKCRVAGGEYQGLEGSIATVNRETESTGKVRVMLPKLGQVVAIPIRHLQHIVDKSMPIKRPVVAMPAEGEGDGKSAAEAAMAKAASVLPPVPEPLKKIGGGIAKGWGKFVDIIKLPDMEFPEDPEDAKQAEGDAEAGGEAKKAEPEKEEVPAYLAAFEMPEGKGRRRGGRGRGGRRR